MPAVNSAAGGGWWLLRAAARTGLRCCLASAALSGALRVGLAVTGRRRRRPIRSRHGSARPVLCRAGKGGGGALSVATPAAGVRCPRGRLLRYRRVRGGRAGRPADGRRAVAPLVAEGGRRV
ncbi:hypothetical protein RSP03_09380 [Cereibacter sphaeroides]|nr:hypothetical protein RSP03_09380 [Cereibacter sphaeroides]